MVRPRMHQTTTSSPPLPPILSLLGDEADLGAMLVRLARAAAAVHMAEGVRVAADEPAAALRPRAPLAEAHP